MNNYLTKVTQSEESYKGFTLRMVQTLVNHTWRRYCEVWKDDKRISVGKYKKEAKMLIDEGYIK